MEVWLESGMWEFMVKHKGKLQYEALGTTVYANPDGLYDPSPNKTKSVRKVVRMIIEEQGGDEMRPDASPQDRTLTQ